MMRMRATYTLPHLLGQGPTDMLEVSRPRMGEISCRDAPTFFLPYGIYHVYCRVARGEFEVLPKFVPRVVRGVIRWGAPPAVVWVKQSARRAA